MARCYRSGVGGFLVSGLALLPLLALLATGCKDKPKAVVAEKTNNVIVAVLQDAPIIDRLTVRASAEPYQKVHLSSEVSGKLTLIAKEEGQPVRKGEKLFSIDKETLEAHLRSTQAAADYTVLNYDRLAKLVESKTASYDELDRARSERDAALAAVENAKAELAKADIFSPIDGLLDSQLAEVGEVMNAGTALGDIVDVKRIKIVVSVPEQDVVYLKVGNRVTVTVDALGNRAFEGDVTFIRQEADAATRTFPVHVVVDNGEGLIRPGMIARMQLVRRTFPRAVTVPLFSVVRHETNYQVFVEEQGAARSRVVQLGIFEGMRVQILEGLKAGDRLIVVGHKNLIDGDKVKVVQVITDPRELDAALVPGGVPTACPVDMAGTAPALPGAAGPASTAGPGSASTAGPGTAAAAGQGPTESGAAATTAAAASTEASPK